MAFHCYNQLYFDVVDLVGRQLDVIASKRDMSHFRLVSREAAMVGERFLFSHVSFTSKWNRSPHARVVAYRHIVSLNPTILRYARQLSLYPCHSTLWLQSWELLDLINAMSQRSAIDTLTIARHNSSDALSGNVVRALLSPLAPAVYTLVLDNIEGLPMDFFSTFSHLRHLDVLGVRLQPNYPPAPNDTATIHRSSTLSTVLSTNHSIPPLRADDPLLLCLDLSQLEFLYCRGTEFHCDGQVLRDVPALAVSSLKSIVVDVSGLFRACYHLRTVLDYPSFSRLSNIYLQTRYPMYGLSHDEDCLMGFRKVVDGLLPGPLRLHLRLDTVVRPDVSSTDICALDWPGLDRSIVHLSQRCVGLTLETRLLTMTVQDTVREQTTLPFQVHCVSFSYLLPRSKRASTVFVLPTP
ncbi:hypothetical protein BKA70DRAFT_1506240 [Coprinopsis sp. MPI-PUGE-AT-0042]|nr:hypothetical protein BKA70DRAFT_1506240 [Coprinopsis sp. MPI-PUGE-AT-0042]